MLLLLKLKPRSLSPPITVNIINRWHSRSTTVVSCIECEKACCRQALFDGQLLFCSVFYFASQSAGQVSLLTSGNVPHTDICFRISGFLQEHVSAAWSLCKSLQEIINYLWCMHALGDNSMKIKYESNDTQVKCDKVFCFSYSLVMCFV